MAEAARRCSLRGVVRWTKPWLDGLPRIIFVNDLGDIFSKIVPFSYIEAEVIDTVTSPEGQRHIWLLFTKRPKRLLDFDHYLAERGRPWPENLWAGISVLGKPELQGIDSLVQVRAAIRFLSCEPLWEAVDLTPWLPQLHWVIIGGESGKKSDPRDGEFYELDENDPAAKHFRAEWAESILEQCREADVAVFMKQFGRNPFYGDRRIQLRDSHGGNWDEWPEELSHLRVRELPHG
jgi:protein gp37